MYIIGNTQYPCKSYSELRICSDFCLKCTSVQTWYGPSIQIHNKVTMLLPWLMRPVLIAYTCSQEGSDLKISFLYLYTKLYLKQKRQKHRDFFFYRCSNLIYLQASSQRNTYTLQSAQKETKLYLTLNFWRKYSFND